MCQALDRTDEIDLVLTSATTLAKTFSNGRVTNVPDVAVAIDDRRRRQHKQFSSDTALTAQMNVVGTSELGLAARSCSSNNTTQRSRSSISSAVSCLPTDLRLL